ncbi:MAG: PP2C family protein-serine/threonine phosphatase [Acidobacteriota bacterium]
MYTSRVSRRFSTPGQAPPAGSHEELIASLIDDLSGLFDLSTPIGDRTIGEAVEDRLRLLRSDEPPAWGGPGDIAQVARVEAGPLDFYYRPHLFDNMEPALRLGHQLQFDLLPRSLPASSPLRIAALLESYCHLSGDLLGWRMEDDQLLLWIADVSGHGIRAGLAAAVLYFLIGALEPGLEPSTLAQRMNDRMHEARNEADEKVLYATAFWLRIGADGRGTYASAGHPPLLVRRASGAIEQLGATGMPVGLVPDQTFGQADFHLDPGDSLVLFTDGLLEACNPEDEEFGLERLAEALREQPGKAVETARGIYRAVRNHRISKLLDDDLTFMVAEPVES